MADTAPTNWKPAYDALQAEMEVVLERVRALEIQRALAREMYDFLCTDSRRGPDATRAMLAWLDADEVIASKGVIA